MSESEHQEENTGKVEPAGEQRTTASDRDASVIGFDFRDKSEKLRYAFTRPRGDSTSMRPLMDKLILDSMDAPAREEVAKYRESLRERFAFTLPDGSPMSNAEKLIVLENAMLEAQDGIIIHETALLTKGAEIDDLAHRKALVLLNQVGIELGALLSDPVEEATKAVRDSVTDPDPQVAEMRREKEIADLKKQLSMEAPSDIPEAEKIDPQK